MMTCQNGPLLADHGQALVDNTLREDSNGGRERVRGLPAISSFAGTSPFALWGSRSASPLSQEMTEMKHIGRYRSPRAGRLLKNRLMLVSMAFCVATCGVLLVFRELRRDGLGNLSEDEALEHLGMGKAMPGDATNESGRILAGSADCTDTAESLGEMFLYLFGVLYCFVGLAIVCDEYFQASLEKISDVLKLTPDVAGATFLAAGSSAPELFTSLTDAFGDSNSTGTGTIVGSAMFNILVIVALSAVVAGSDGAEIPVDWRPVCRDVSFYSLSILLLTLVFLDSEVEWWEGLIMFLAYGVYIIFMVFNTKILKQCERCDKDKRMGAEVAVDEHPQRGDIDISRLPHLVEVPPKSEESISAKSGFNFPMGDGESGLTNPKRVFVHEAGNGDRASEPDISSVSTVDSKINLMNGDTSGKNASSHDKDPELGRNQPNAGDHRGADAGGAQPTAPGEKTLENMDEGEDDDDPKVFFWPDTTLDKVKPLVILLVDPFALCAACLVIVAAVNAWCIAATSDLALISPRRKYDNLETGALILCCPLNYIHLKCPT